MSIPFLQPDSNVCLHYCFGWSADESMKLAYWYCGFAYFMIQIVRYTAKVIHKVIHMFITYPHKNHPISQTYPHTYPHTYPQSNYAYPHVWSPYCPCHTNNNISNIFSVRTQTTTYSGLSATSVPISLSIRLITYSLKLLYPCSAIHASIDSCFA